MADRQRLESQRIDQAEDGGVSPDSQRQREDRHGGESGAGAQSANRITNVLHNGVEHFAIMTPSELRLAPPRISNAACNFRPFESSSRPFDGTINVFGSRHGSVR